jgi:hypothetical protein
MQQNPALSSFRPHRMEYERPMLQLMISSYSGKTTSERRTFGKMLDAVKEEILEESQENSLSQNSPEN